MELSFLAKSRTNGPFRYFCFVIFLICSETIFRKLQKILIINMLQFILLFNYLLIHSRNVTETYIMIYSTRKYCFVFSTLVDLSFLTWLIDLSVQTRCIYISLRLQKKLKPAMTQSHSKSNKYIRKQTTLISQENILYNFLYLKKG